MNRPSLAQLALVALALALVANLGWLHVRDIMEAYGAGPPYYGRTTNMDKWSDPLPDLLVLDGVVVLIIAAAFAAWRRWSRDR